MKCCKPTHDKQPVLPFSTGVIYTTSPMHSRIRQNKSMALGYVAQFSICNRQCTALAQTQTGQLKKETSWNASFLLRVVQEV
jgi:hypothetical protein